MKNMYSPTGWERPVEGKSYKQKKHLEDVLELIDNFAEVRHTCGHWSYNLKSNEARQKVIAALKGE